MGYLVCEKCNGYYELEEGESADDFGNCQCGGQLKHIESIEKPNIIPKRMENTYHNANKLKSVSTDMMSEKIAFSDRNENDSKHFCTECGGEVAADTVYCPRCGYNLNGENKQDKKISRNIELVLGILGGIFGLLGGIFAVFFSVFAADIYINGISAILASIVGIGGSIYVLRDAKLGGIILIVSALWLLISVSFAGIIGTVLLGVAGLLALFRK